VAGFQTFVRGRISAFANTQPAGRCRCGLGASRAFIVERFRNGREAMPARGQFEDAPDNRRFGLVDPSLATLWRVSKSTAARWLASGRLPASVAGVRQTPINRESVSL
jgi:hypothetical protein